jgi:hypothetical protein
VSVSKAPFVVRWRDAVMDDPTLSWRAKASAMPLVRHANVKTGHDCYPGAATCAREMSLSENTIKRGWTELREAGWLEIKPLPASRRRTQGALKVMRFAPNSAPDRVQVATGALSGPKPAPDRVPTFPGNREPSGPSAPRGGTAPHPGKPERAEPERYPCARAGCANTTPQWGGWCDECKAAHGRTQPPAPVRRPGSTLQRTLERFGDDPPTPEELALDIEKELGK